MGRQRGPASRAASRNSQTCAGTPGHPCAASPSTCDLSGWTSNEQTSQQRTREQEAKSTTVFQLDKKDTFWPTSSLGAVKSGKNMSWRAASSVQTLTALQNQLSGSLSGSMMFTTSWTCCSLAPALPSSPSTSLGELHTSRTRTCDAGALRPQPLSRSRPESKLQCPARGARLAQTGSTLDAHPPQHQLSILQMGVVGVVDYQDLKRRQDSLSFAQRSKLHRAPQQGLQDAPGRAHVPVTRN